MSILLQRYGYQREIIEAQFGLRFSLTAPVPSDNDTALSEIRYVGNARC
jgi:hypothetical protein